MKTLIKHSLIVAVLFTTLNSYASGVGPLVKVESKENKVFTLKLNDLKSQEVKILIKDEDGIILHNESVNVNAQYIKKYDIAALPSGDYTLEVEDQNAIKIIPFEVTFTDVLFEESNQTQIFKPYVRLRGAMVDVMFKANENKPTRVVIYNKEGKVLETQKVVAGQNVEKIFDFSSIGSGDYSIDIQNGERTFSQEITITK